jgi:hypothetical protein
MVGAVMAQHESIAKPEGIGCFPYIFLIGCLFGVVIEFHEGHWVSGGITLILGAGVALAIWNRHLRTDSHRTGYEQLKRALELHVGQGPDYGALTGAGQAFFAFVPARKFYLAPANLPFNVKRLRGAEDVREWKVNWTNAVNHGSDSSNTYKTGFTIGIQLRDIANPLAKIDCTDEWMAYRVQELLNQMFGAEPA